ncbi:hypothetical protein GTQ40_12180 [Flavobacteriaceae bacterium R38]|nr:hypothetical protein [Flavobacteriaceae bacterium R38]
MKITAFVMLILFAVKGCAQSSKIDESAIEIEYMAYSRGGFQSVVINSDFIKEKSQRGQEDYISRKYSKKDWKKILNYLAAIDLEALKNLEAPTQKRLFDGAMHASLKIIYKDKTYQSGSFDHGTPPEEIKPLVDHILSLTQSVE